MSTLEKTGIGIGIAIVASLILLGIWRASFFTFVDNYELGYKFDALNGEITLLTRKNEKGEEELRQGYIFKWPFIEHVHTIDLKPMQICINANSRVLNCKLVKFNPEGLKTFIDWHGRGNYASGSTVSGSLMDIMKSYAYDPSNKAYPFLTIIKEDTGDNFTLSTSFSSTTDTTHAN